MKLWRYVFLTVAMPITAAAQVVETSDDVLDALRLPELLGVMYEEAMVAGEELIQDFAPDRAGDGWTATLERINDASRAEATMRIEFRRALPEDQLPAIAEFVDTKLARAFVKLEVSARRALLDPDVEEGVVSFLPMYETTHPERLEQVTRFIKINDLIDSNVIGALNSNAAFLAGMQSVSDNDLVIGGDSDIMRQVWAQEPEIRASTTEWVNSYLMMAYLPVPSDKMEAYIAFADSEPGQALNEALFHAFDVMFVKAARETGRALALIMSSEDI